MGGVIGLSASGLGSLLLSSVMPGAFPDPDALTVESEVPGVVEAKGAIALGMFDGAGEEVVGERRMLNRALWSVVVNDEGADFRLSMEGAEYVCA